MRVLACVRTRFAHAFTCECMHANARDVHVFACMYALRHVIVCVRSCTCDRVCDRARCMRIRVASRDRVRVIAYAIVHDACMRMHVNVHANACVHRVCSHTLAFTRPHGFAYANAGVGAWVCIGIYMHASGKFHTEFTMIIVTLV